MARELVWSAFNGGLRTATPALHATTERMSLARGLRRPIGAAARSRLGSTLAAALDAHSIFRFADVNYYGVGTTLLRDTTTIKTGLDGSRLSFVRAPVTPGKDDYLFCAGGGELFKTDSAGDDTAWGIAPFSDGFTAAVVDPEDKQIHAFEDHTDWTSSGTLTKGDATGALAKEGTNSLSISVDSDTVAKVWDNITSTDLTTFGATASPLEDHIRFWLLISNPENVASLELAFDVSGSGFDGSGDSNDTLSYVLTAAEDDSLLDNISGIGEAFDEAEINLWNQFLSQGAGTIDPNTGEPVKPESFSSVLTRPHGVNSRLRHRRSFRTASATWVRIAIPKVLFTGDDTKWNAITGIRFTLTTNDAGTTFAYFDDLALQGGYGLQGDYKVLVTAKNSTTGHRSNPNPTAVAVDQVDRQKIRLSGLPTTHPDPQVDTLQVWRTVGHGSRYFLDTEISLGTATVDLTNADSRGLHGSATVIGPDELTVNHLVPPSTIEKVFGPVNGYYFLLANTATGFKGRAHYTRQGYPEAIAAYFRVSEEDDPLVAGVEWNRRAWMLSENHLFEIIGTEPPFIPREVIGAPGTVNAESVQSIRGGIIYEAEEGMVIFNGATSEPLGEEAVGLLFQGTPAGGLDPFDSVVSGYGGSEYMISDDQDTLIVSKSGAWRLLGLPVQSIHYDRDNKGFLIGTYDDRILLLDREGVFDDAGVGIPLDWSTEDTAIDPRHAGQLAALHFDIDTGGMALAVTVYADGVAYPLDNIITSGRRVYTVPACIPGRLLRVRLNGTVTQAVTLYEIAGDVSQGDPT